MVEEVIRRIKRDVLEIHPDIVEIPGIYL